MRSCKKLLHLGRMIVLLENPANSARLGLLRPPLTTGPDMPDAELEAQLEIENYNRAQTNGWDVNGHIQMVRR